MRPKRGVPKDLEEAKGLKKGLPSFRRKGDGVGAGMEGQEDSENDQHHT
jgi:hypothetical protein